MDYKHIGIDKIVKSLSQQSYTILTHKVVSFLDD